MEQIISAKRPAEVVRNYIEVEFFGPDAKPDERLPTIHEFATHLGVSSSTVRSVLKIFVKKGMLTTIPGKGTFLKSEARNATRSLHNCLGINTEAQLNGWAGAIFLGATNEALKANMMLTALDTVQMPNPGMKDIRKTLNRVDGVIAFPVVHHVREIDLICEEKNLPLVHINPPHFHHTSNFVSNDYFGSVYNLALAWREAGRRKVVLTFADPISKSVSASQIYSAFSLAYASCPEASLVVLDGECFEQDEKSLSGSGRETGYRRMTQYLQKYNGKVDAAYCFGDYLAEGVVQALSEASLSVPEDVSVVGGTGLDNIQLQSGHLVTLKQPLRLIGERAVQMLIWRIRNHSLNAPGVYLMPELSAGTTIRKEERTAFERLIARKNKWREAPILP
ncbi:MAG: substrate-binding domain-containing protein [Terrimicrobiaceae bacterium]